jgi:hypothetical protein
MNNYASVSDLKTALGITSTTDDVIMRKILDAASRMIDIYTSRFFYCKTQTRYFAGAGSRLWVDDLLSINTSGLKTDEDGDATFENTFATTDYILKPLNTYPKTHIEISDDSDYSGFANGIKKGVEIAGLWGYGDGISATPYIVDTTLATTISSASTTAVVVTAVTNLSAGQTILMDTEQMFIYSIDTTTKTLTVERGVNGTTAAASHTAGISLYIYQYPYDVWQACINLASAIYQNRAKQGIQTERLGDYAYTLTREAVNAILSDTISGYRRVSV